jgi:hypothetical protein
MDILIGLGSVGYKLTKAFSKHPQYKIITIDHEEGSTIRVPKCDHPEEYEKNFPLIGKELRDVEGEILFIVAGSSIISGAALRVLEQLQGKGNVSILYIHPDVDTLSDTRRLQTNYKPTLSSVCYNNTPDLVFSNSSTPLITSRWIKS